VEFGENSKAVLFDMLHHEQFRFWGGYSGYACINSFLDAGGRDSNMRSLPSSYGLELGSEKYKGKWKTLHL